MDKILLVEDEKNFATILKDYLIISGFEILLCENGEDGINSFKENNFDLCILDVMLPKKDGFTLAKEIKALNPSIPILFLTAKAIRDDVIKGYKIGAHDYITKPFDLEVLLYKINAILNRTISSNLEKYLFEINKIILNTKLRSLTINNQIIKLSPKETLLLRLLIEHKNDVLPRKKALLEIWQDDSYFNARSMDVFIVKLRKYFTEETGVQIVNVHGEGYSLQVDLN